MSIYHSFFQSDLKKPLIIFGVCFLIFLGSLGNWIANLYEENKKLMPLQKEIYLQQNILSSAQKVKDFKEKIGPLSLAAIKPLSSYASSWDIEKPKLISFLKDQATLYTSSDLIYQFGPTASDIQIIPIDLTLHVQNLLSIFQFISALYQGPYSLYLTNLSINKAETESFKVNLSLKWSFPKHRNTGSLLDFLLKLNVSSLESPLTFEEELSILALILQKKKATPLKKDILSPHLEGILYINPKEWTVWIDNYSITSKNNPSSYIILSVTPYSTQLKTSQGPLLLSLQKQHTD